jgi:hypothetical protein
MRCCIRLGLEMARLETRRRQRRRRQNSIPSLLR